MPRYFDSARNSAVVTTQTVWLQVSSAQVLQCPSRNHPVTGAPEQALSLHAGERTPLDWLQRLGGLEIAALSGAYIACAQAGISVLVDGFICSVAALLTVRLNPGVADWLLFSHCGAEPDRREG